jgi:ABC-type Mn2+/Zn2+ transport system permease subunit
VPSAAASATAPPSSPPIEAVSRRAVAAAEGTGGLLLAYHLDLPPGPAIAVIGGGLFALVALGGGALRVAR